MPERERGRGEAGVEGERLHGRRAAGGERTGSQARRRFVKEGIECVRDGKRREGTRERPLAGEGTIV